MNTDMYTNIITSEHVGKIKERDERNYFITPETKILACGVEGIGALPKTRTIVNFIKGIFNV